MESDQKALLKKIKIQLFLLGKLKIPMIGYTRARLIEITDTSAQVKIKLKRRTKNHLNSMYFGALAIGADLSGALHAFHFSNKYERKISFAFKGMSCEFIKRAESDCTFISEDGKKVEAAVLKSIETGERINETTHVNVYDKDMDLVATFEMVISVKCK